VWERRLRWARRLPRTDRSELRLNRLSDHPAIVAQDSTTCVGPEDNAGMAVRPLRAFGGPTGVADLADGQTPSHQAQSSGMVLAIACSPLETGDISAWGPQQTD
jgi:hypothetical protein